MPRRSRSQAAEILRFFAETELSSAELVLGLAQDVVKSRRPQPALPAATRARARRKKAPAGGTPLPGTQTTVGD